MAHPDAVFFFARKPAALPLYEVLEQRLLERVGGVTIKVQKTQISFSNRRMFACVSLLPVSKKKDRPESYITVTFGLPYKKESPRIDAATEPYPNRWTHHVLIGRPEEIDGELLAWLTEAAAFAAAK